MSESAKVVVRQTENGYVVSPLRYDRAMGTVAEVDEYVCRSERELLKYIRLALVAARIRQERVATS